MKLVSLVECNEDLVYPQLAAVQGAIQRKTESPSKHLSWSETYCKVKYLPEYWLAAFLYLCVAIKKATLDKIDDVDSELGIRNTFEVLSQLDGQDSMPTSMLNKDACAKVLAVRVSEVNRVPGWVAAFVKADGKIDWGKAGAYEVIWKQGRRPAIRHRGSGDAAQVPDHLPIDQTWSIANNVTDMRAHFVKGTTEQFIHKLFKEGEGPHKLAITKKNTLKMLHDRMENNEVQPVFATEYDQKLIHSEDRNAILKKADETKRHTLKRASATKSAKVKRAKVVNLV